MKTFRDLYLHLNGVDMSDLANKLTNQCQPPWSRNKDKEDHLGILEGPPLCFERNLSPSAALFLYQQDKDTWYVSNIVPTSTSELSYDEYNKVLEDFLNSIVEPVINNTTVKAEMTRDEITIGSVAGEEVEKALASFSLLANKSTGSSHPSDRKRWFNFLVLANKSASDLGADLVYRALMEQGWSDEQANKLAGQFENANDLLTYYQEW